MTPTNATQTVAEMTTHVLERLRGISGLTDNSIQNLIFSWIRSEQPGLLDVLNPDKICETIKEQR